MAFDSAGFDPLPNRPPEEPHQTASVKERILCAIGLIVGLALLFMPISASGLIDLANYLTHK